LNAGCEWQRRRLFVLIGARKSLNKALSGEGNPSFATLLKVMSALGIKLHAEIAHG
jgi:hypothetical protein